MTDPTDTSSADKARKWLSDLRLAKKEDEKWCKRGKKIVKRFRDERSGVSDQSKRYNILWSNIQTMLPALYGKTPQADVSRRFKDQDPVGRTAALILERALQYEIDHYGDFDNALRSAVLDRLLPGRGTAWVRFESKEVTTTGGPQEYECTPTDYVFWEDFRCSPARTWDEVTWVARRVYMSRKDGVARFGEDFKDVPLTHEPVGLDEMKNLGGEQVDADSMKKAQVWEIWHKTDKVVCWVAEGYSKLLDEKADPYGLDCFWPCPKPLFATQSTDTLVPVPDYALYQDQAEELDKLTQRISMLVEAVKVVGVYDSSQAGVQRMLSEGVNNTLIPVDNWAALAEKGGIKGTVDFLPLDMVVNALNSCYEAREQCKQVIYEVTGLSDIIRGASVASETATAQQIKSQYASLRLRRMQMEVAQFASEILRIKAQLMADLYRPEVLVEMSGIMGTLDAQYAQQAVDLLKSEPARSFRIEVASDSLVEMDEATEKASRTEFLSAMGSFMQQVLPVAQAAPEMKPLIGEMMQFTVRAFKGGRTLESAFEAAIAKLSEPPPPPPPPQPTDAEVKAQTAIEQAQITARSKEQIAMFTAQMDARLEQMLEGMRQQGETQRAMLKAELDATVRSLTAPAGPLP